VRVDRLSLHFGSLGQGWVRFDTVDKGPVRPGCFFGAIVDIFVSCRRNPVLRFGWLITSRDDRILLKSFRSVVRAARTSELSSDRTTRWRRPEFRD